MPCSGVLLPLGGVFCGRKSGFGRLPCGGFMRGFAGGLAGAWRGFGGDFLFGFSCGSSFGFSCGIRASIARASAPRHPLLHRRIVAAVIHRNT